MRIANELMEKARRGGQPHPKAAATRRILDDMQRFEARIGEVPEEDRETARALMLGWTASRAVGELEERLIAVEQRLAREDDRRSGERLQHRSATAGWR